MRIDEALLRDRDEEERPDYPTKSSLAEHLQLVHYSKDQEVRFGQIESENLYSYYFAQHFLIRPFVSISQYTSHHDWGVEELGNFDSNLTLTQGTRFATLLLYLNSGMEGGETSVCTTPR